MPYLENLAIAQQICERIKQSTVCSNDIIPRVDLPYLTYATMRSIKAKFGDARVDAYMEHTHVVNQVRQVLIHAATRLEMHAPTSSAAIAITKLGVGECQELATVAFS